MREAVISYNMLGFTNTVLAADIHMTYGSANGNGALTKACIGYNFATEKYRIVRLSRKTAKTFAKVGLLLPADLVGTDVTRKEQ